MKWIAALAVTVAMAQPPPAAPPKVLRIIREVIKPGKVAAGETMAALAARAIGRSKYPVKTFSL